MTVNAGMDVGKGKHIVSVGGNTTVSMKITMKAPQKARSRSTT